MLESKISVNKRRKLKLQIVKCIFIFSQSSMSVQKFSSRKRVYKYQDKSLVHFAIAQHEEWDGILRRSTLTYCLNSTEKEEESRYGKLCPDLTNI